MVSSACKSHLFLALMMYAMMASSSRLLFVRSFVFPTVTRSVGSRLSASTLPEIASMRAGEIKKELDVAEVSFDLSKKDPDFHFYFTKETF